jgi:hypothetical protein
VDRAVGSDPEGAAAQYLLGLRCTASRLFHYPWFSLPACVPKGLAYIGVALFVLPSGIWSAVAGHVIIDALSFGGEALFRWRASPPERSR